VWLSFPSIRLVVHPVIHLSFHPSKAKRGRVQALLKLQNSIVSGNCPFYPIYSTIGIHSIMKGYWLIIKISGKHWGRLDMQSVQPIFSLFWGEGGIETWNYFFQELNQNKAQGLIFCETEIKTRSILIFFSSSFQELEPEVLHKRQELPYTGI